MLPNRLRRLRGFAYLGPHRYSLTFCAHDRQSLFDNHELACCVRQQILRSATEDGYVVTVYCIMPDHMHLLVEGSDESAKLSDFVKRAKQYSGFHGKNLIGGPVWQTGFFERVLRENDDTRALVAYILDNPVRAHLVARVQDYPHIGPGVWTLEELLGSV